MPAASLTDRNANLSRLKAGVKPPHCPVDPARASRAGYAAARMPLSHATNCGVFEKILGGRELLSQVRSASPPGAAETLLETADDGFFYVAAFTYPNTECGFLFQATLENDFMASGVATPFDSGALAHKVPPPAPYADALTFVRHHELPVPGYRSLLESIIANDAPSAEAFLIDPVFRCSCGAPRAHPFGLTGADRRGNTFDVRIPRSVPIESPHLRAVFVRNGFEPRGLHRFVSAGVGIVRSSADDDADRKFAALREASIQFILEHFLKS